jgi:hypothetical protein
MAPVKIDKKIQSSNNLKDKQIDKITTGAIFCQVIKIKLLIQFNPSITLGNQKWKGATPLFNINEEEKIILINKFIFVK